LFYIISQPENKYAAETEDVITNPLPHPTGNINRDVADVSEYSMSSFSANY